MFRMLEVVGVSSTGFSDAVKNAINQIIEADEKVHFFEVIEQRGAVRDGKLKEYQVKLKVAVELEAPAKASAKNSFHVCPTCMQPAGKEGHLCIPTTKKDEKCNWCGSLIPNERHLCDDKIKELSYICNTCGRTAVKAEHLCSPKKIKK